MNEEPVGIQFWRWFVALCLVLLVVAAGYLCYVGYRTDQAIYGPGPAPTPAPTVYTSCAPDMPTDIPPCSTGG